MVDQNKQSETTTQPQKNVQQQGTQAAVPVQNLTANTVQGQSVQQKNPVQQNVPRIPQQPQTKLQNQGNVQLQQQPQTQPLQQPQQQPKVPAPAGKKRILIAEDEKAITSVLQIKLGSNGFEVDIANNGREAIELLKAKQYDVVLLDLIMPIINGFEVLEFAHKSGVKAPIIVTSNLSQKEDIEKAKSLGAKQYFVKSEMTLTNIVDLLNKFKHTN
jgi:CheY-like chemotaxis protein